MAPRCTKRVSDAAAHLRRGQLVAIPTETVYGLAARADDPEAVDRVFALKGRPSTNPLIVHLPGTEHILNWASSVPESAQKLIQSFWPGPLTLVLPARPDVSPRITAGQQTVALRLPSHPLCQELLQTLNCALVAPSANRSMSISPTCAEHVKAQFPDSDLCILDGGACAVGLESTIVSALPHQAVRVLRPGMITPDELSQVLPLAEQSDGALSPPAHSDDSPRVPGQQSRHYAPTTQAHWVAAPLPEALLQDPTVGWLNCGRALNASGPVLDLGPNADSYAQQLYAALYQLDKLGLREIRILPLPETQDWEAIRNRLGRATCHANPVQDSGM